MRPTYLWHSLLDFLFPRHCPGCRATLTEAEAEICIDCIVRLPRTHQTKSLENNQVARHLRSQFPFHGIAALMWFEEKGLSQRLLHQLKYHHSPGLAFRLGQLLGEELKEHAAFVDPVHLVPIPLHWRKLNQRGYNQAQLIAEGIADVLPVVSVWCGLRRTKHTETQTGKNREARARNMENVFAPSQANPTSKGAIWLIDDVITTGATLTAAALTLQTSGFQVKGALGLAAVLPDQQSAEKVEKSAPEVLEKQW